MGDSFIGSVIGGHRITRLVGRGGMGIVYQAVDLSLDRTVAVKLIAPELAEDQGFRGRFMAESKVAASIDHPNVLPIFTAGEQDGVLFLAMRYVVGRDLRTVVEQDGRLSPQRAGRMVAQIGSALDAAHARRLVHRDVKPSNVLLDTDDHAYLTDFGLVKDLGVSVGDTRSGEVLGTLDYVAPELIRGEAVGPWTDVYALGCLLFFTLTGRVVFPLDTPESKLWAHLSEPPHSVSAVCPDLPGTLDAVVAQALAKSPEERYGSASAFATAAIEAAGRPAAAVHGDDSLAKPIAELLDAARRSEQGIRTAITRAQLPLDEVSLEVDGFLRTLEEAATRAQLLHVALESVPPAAFERRLADIRSRHVPGKAQLVDALARQLQVQRTMEKRLASFYAEMEQVLVELETVRGEVLSAPGAGGTDAERRLAGDVRDLCDELGAVAEDMETAIAEGRAINIGSVEPGDPPP